MPELDPALIAEARAAYAEGRNVTELLRGRLGVTGNTPEIVEFAYDLQAGSYIDRIREDLPKAKAYAAELANLLGDQVSATSSLLDVGTGEMTTLSLILQALPVLPSRILACDISWSRLAVGRNFARETLGEAAPIAGFAAEIGALRLADGAVDIVTSSHALEPNGTRLEPLLTELFRVTRRRLVLFEPCWERASPEARQRMDRLGYIRGLEEGVTRLGGTVERVVPIQNVANPLNPTFGFILVPPSVRAAGDAASWTVPGTSLPLTRTAGIWYSSDTGLAFPELDGVPMFTRSSAMLASALEQIGKP